MKRKSLIIITLILAMVFAFTTNAFAASMSANGSATVVQGKTATITFQISSVTISSGSIEISCSSDLEIVSGKWLLSGTMMADYSNGKGAAAFAGAKAVSGNYFQVTVKGKNISKNATVTAKAQLKNGSTVVGEVSATKTVSVICSSHSYGDWTTVNATCTANGSKTRTCSVCGTVDKQTLYAAGHKLTNATITKAPTCLENGTQTGTCSVCGASVTETVNAKGHDFGPWISTKASTCTEAGTEVRTCKSCGAKEEQASALADHDFGTNYEVVREATISVPGLISGTCVLCGQSAELETPCSAECEEAGASISAEEGVFLPGTEVHITKIESDKIPEQASVVISSISGNYQAYSVEAVLDGAVVQPNGSLEVTFAVPEELTGKLAVAYIGDDGSYEFVSSVLNEDGTITATLNHFSTYAIVELEYNEPSTGGGAMLYVAMGEAIIIVVLVVLLFSKKKKVQ